MRTSPPGRSKFGSRRTCSMAGTVRRSIPSPSPWPRPPAETGDTGFHYTIDEETGEIVIRNYRTIEASYHFTCQIGYDFYPYQVADGYEKGEIQADFRVKDSKGDLTAESEQLSVSVHTETKKPEAYKSVNHKYELWQDAWGEKPADAADYFYVEWQLYTTLKRGTQPFTFTLQEDLGDYGEFVGWRATSAGSYTLGSQAEFEQTIFDTDGPNSTATTAYSKTIYVLARYPPVDAGDDERRHQFLHRQRKRLRRRHKDGDGQQKLYLRRAGPFLPGRLLPRQQERRQGHHRRRQPAAGGQKRGKLLLRERDAPGLWDDKRRAGPVHDSPGGRAAVPGREAAGGGGLHPDELLSHRATEYGYKIDPEQGYQAVLDQDYDAYAPVTVWVKTADAPDAWANYGTVTRTSSGYTWHGADGSASAVSSAARVSLPEGTTKVRFTHTATRYQVSFGASFYS